MDLLIRPEAPHSFQFVLIEMGSNLPVNGQVSCIVEVLTKRTQVTVEFVITPDSDTLPILIADPYGDAYVAENGIVLSGQYQPAEVLSEPISGEALGRIRGFFHINNVRVEGS